jgi:hypothetical protein
MVKGPQSAFIDNGCCQVLVNVLWASECIVHSLSMLVISHVINLTPASRGAALQLLLASATNSDDLRCCSGCSCSPTGLLQDRQQDYCRTE